ncbi:MAG TPA: S1C family serine protease [Aliidongia sp.]|nr:S1C family serine protease [Aliidongia sp.]
MTEILFALADHLSRMAEKSRSQVAVQAGQAASISGIHWRPGLVVTAEERLERDEEIFVTDPAGHRIAATLVGRDPSTDIALLRLAGAPDPALAVAERAEAGLPRAGTPILALGWQDGPIAAFGIVGFVGGAWRSIRGGIIDSLVRLDLSLDPAAEGGALVDLQGKVLGMTVYGPRRRTLVIPAATIDRVVDRLLEKGHVARGYLGAGLQSVRLGAGAGLLVVSLDPAGPAARAGLLIGDILLIWNGRPVSRVGDIMSALGPDSVATAIELDLMRGGARLPLKLTIGERVPD